METINKLLDQPSTNRLADKTAPLVNDWQGLTDPNFDLYHKKFTNNGMENWMKSKLIKENLAE